VQDLDKLVAAATKQIETTTELSQLEQIRVDYLGKKGSSRMRLWNI